MVAFLGVSVYLYVYPGDAGTNRSFFEFRLARLCIVVFLLLCFNRSCHVFADES